MKRSILTCPNDYIHSETQERHVNPSTPSDHISSPSPRIGESTCQPNPISLWVKKRRKSEGVVKSEGGGPRRSRKSRNRANEADTCSRQEKKEQKGRRP